MDVSDVLYHIPYVLLGLVTVATIVISVLLSRNVYRRALYCHATRCNFAANPLARKEKQFVESLQAEETVEQILREEGWKKVFLRRRIHVSRVGHNREIDVIAVGPVILVIEVKHWQGQVWSNGSRWYQMPNTSTKYTLQFEDVQEDNIIKAAALRRYIENSRRIRLPDFQHVWGKEESEGEKGSGSHGTWYSDRTLHKQYGSCIVPVVVFTHPNVKLDPATVKAQPHVFTLELFRIFVRETLHGTVSLDKPNHLQVGETYSHWVLNLFNRCGGSGLFNRHAQNQMCAFKEVALGKETQDSVSEAVDMLRTWDVIRLHNGNFITGDIQQIIAPSAKCMYERRDVLDIFIHWNAGALGILRTLLSNHAGTVEIRLTTAKRLAVKTKANVYRSEDGNMKFPVASKGRSRNRNDRVTIKVAGAISLQTYDLADIKEICLSRHLYELERHL